MTAHHTVKKRNKGIVFIFPNSQYYRNDCVIDSIWLYYCSWTTWNFPDALVQKQTKKPIGHMLVGREK